MINRKLIKEICKQRNVRKSTQKGYESSLNKYSEFNNLTLENLLKEALTEEKKMIPLKERTIKQRLINYKSYLLESDLSANTAKTYFSKVIVFYKHYEVEIPNLPKSSVKKEYELAYKDLPSKEDIRNALSISDPLMKAIILFMSSSGTAKAETQ